MMDAEMGMDAGMMEGGAVERRSALSRSSKRSVMSKRSAASRSSSKSVKSVKSNRSFSKAQKPMSLYKKETAKTINSQAFNEIDTEHTPRGSMKEQMGYE